MSGKVDIELNVNGDIHEITIESQKTLSEVLRGTLGLTGAKEGCSGLGECGTCTVIIDGKAVMSCLVLAVSAVGKEIITIEGLSAEDGLHPLQKAFVEHGAIQCGYCTPGMIMSAKALLDGNPRPTEREIRKGISGNLCRCTGYAKIVEAIRATAEEYPPSSAT